MKRVLIGALDFFACLALGFFVGTLLLEVWP
jgi:hypothetical protein